MVVVLVIVVVVVVVVVVLSGGGLMVMYGSTRYTLGLSELVDDVCRLL